MDLLSKRDAVFGTTNYKLNDLWVGRALGSTAKALGEVIRHRCAGAAAYRSMRRFD